ncbi:hypothetical protein JCM19233_761 [Vibrio astriarenae]|nr:hypothetical protein JCM19233_761 [Vibrio sp. C7]
MYDGDFLEFNQEYYVVVCDQPPIEEIEQPKVVEPETKPTKKKEKVNLVLKRANQILLQARKRNLSRKTNRRNLTMADEAKSTSSNPLFHFQGGSSPENGHLSALIPRW